MTDLLLFPPCRYTWRSAVALTETPSQLRALRGLRPLSVLVPDLCTNISPQDTSVQYIATLPAPLAQSLLTKLYTESVRPPGQCIASLCKTLPGYSVSSDCDQPGGQATYGQARCQQEPAALLSPVSRCTSGCSSATASSSITSNPGEGCVSQSLPQKPHPALQYTGEWGARLQQQPTTLQRQTHHIQVIPLACSASEESKEQIAGSPRGGAPAATVQHQMGAPMLTRTKSGYLKGFCKWRPRCRWSTSTSSPVTVLPLLHSLSMLSS